MNLEQEFKLRKQSVLAVIVQRLQTQSDFIIPAHCYKRMTFHYLNTVHVQCSLYRFPVLSQGFSVINLTHQHIYEKKITQPCPNQA